MISDLISDHCSAPLCSKDAGLVHEDRWVPVGDTNEDDGFSQDIQFELRGKQGIYLVLHECNDTTVCPEYYSVDIANQGSRFQIWKNGGKKIDQNKPWKYRPYTDQYKSYNIRSVFTI